LFVSFAFLFGSTVSKCFDSLVFLFFSHPFDVGDRLLINGSPYTVSHIGLLSTILESFEGQSIFFSNSILATTPIFNIRRSNPKDECIRLKIAWSTPYEKIEKLTANLKEWTKKEYYDFQPKVAMGFNNIQNIETLTINIVFFLKRNAQNWDLYLNRRSKFMAALSEEIKKLDIEWHPLPREYIRIRD
jgi:small-conductance mechanosensitive channel